MTDYLTEYRNRHDREENHFGTFEANLVQLAYAIGAVPAGSTLEDLIRAIDQRINRLENADIVFANVRADAVAMRPMSESLISYSMLRTTTQSSFTQSSVVKRQMAGSWVSDAALLRMIMSSIVADALIKWRGFTADAFIQPFFKADAEITLYARVNLSLEADAMMMRYVIGSFAADARIKSEMDMLWMYENYPSGEPDGVKTTLATVWRYSKFR